MKINVERLHLLETSTLPITYSLKTVEALRLSNENVFINPEPLSSAEAGSMTF